jgi:hypothetical protein
VADACEHGNEPSGSIKCWKESRVTEQVVISHERLNSMELVRLLVNSTNIVTVWFS